MSRLIRNAVLEHWRKWSKNVILWTMKGDSKRTIQQRENQKCASKRITTNCTIWCENMFVFGWIVVCGGASRLIFIRVEHNFSNKTEKSKWEYLVCLAATTFCCLICNCVSWRHRTEHFSILFRSIVVFWNRMKKKASISKHCGARLYLSASSTFRSETEKRNKMKRE